MTTAAGADSFQSGGGGAHPRIWDQRYSHPWMNSSTMVDSSTLNG